MSQASLCTAHSASQSLRSMPAGVRGAWKGGSAGQRGLNEQLRSALVHPNSAHPRLEASFCNPCLKAGNGKMS